MEEEESGDLRSGPLIQRVVDSRWKCRQIAFEELSGLFGTSGPDDKIHEEYLKLWPKIVADKNAAAQESGVKALNAALEYGPPALFKSVAATLSSALVGECLKGRQKTVELATESMLLLCELENGAAVVEALVKEGFSHKVKKLVPVAVETATACLKAFGPQDFPPQLLLKAFPELFLSADAKIRDAGKALVIELRRWVGAMLDKPIEVLRPAQIKELKASFDEIASAEKPKPTRLTRSKQKVAAAAGASGGAGGGAAVAEAAAPAFDPFAMMEPQEVAGKLPGTWFDETADKNWKARSEALDKLIALADVARIKPGDFGPIVTVLKKLIAKDANVVVVAKAAQAVALLANGLRADFTPYAKSTVPVILEKFKEKKASVIQQLHGSMDPISMYCFPIKDGLEIIGEALKSKIPNAKIETLKWLVRATSTGKPDDIVPALKAYIGLIMECLNDATPEVRDLACHVLAWLEMRLGEKRMKPFFASLDKIKAAKVAEFVQKEKEAATAAPTATTTAAPAAAVPGPAAVSTAAPAAKSAAGPATKVVASKPNAPAPTSTSTASVTAVAPTPAPAQAARAAVARVWTEESAIQAGQGLVSDEVRGLLTHENFKARLKGVTQLTDMSDEALMADGGLSYPLMAFVSQVCGGFAREANFQVVQAVFDLASRLAALKAFDANVIRFVAPILLDKLGDFKLQKGASSCLDNLVSATSVDTVFHALYAPLEATKNAKAVPNVLKWMAGVIDEFGLAPSFSCADLATSLAKTVLNNKQAPIKKAGVVLLGSVFKNVPRGGVEEENLKKAVASMSGVEPAVIQQINEQFTLVGATAPASYAQVPKMAGGPGPTFSKTGSAAAGGAGSDDAPVATAAAVAVVEDVAPVATPATAAAPPVRTTPLVKNGQKSARSAAAWTVSGEHDAVALQQLKTDLLECASLDLIRSMTGTSHDDVAETARVLNLSISGNWEAVLDCSDVIFKWVMLRLRDRDSVTLQAGIDVLRKLVDAFVSHDARLDAGEAVFFLPFLASATGHPSDHVVSAVKDVLVSLTKVHPVSKLFVVLLQVVSSTGSSSVRARRECLDLLSTLIQRQGLSVASGVSHGDLVLQVANLLNDHDTPLHSTAAATLQVLEARLGSGEMLQMIHPVLLREQVVRVLADLKGVSTPKRDASTHAEHRPHQVSVPFSSPMHRWLESLSTGDENGVIDAIKNLCSDMDSLAAQSNSANSTVVALIHRLWPGKEGDGMRVRKYLVNGLLTVVSHRGCALKVELAAIDSVVRSVLNELCGPATAASAQNADRQAFLKALNVMMFRLLENCRPQLTCAVLVNLLTASIDPAAKSDYVPSKYSDLTMKCLVKLSKSLSSLSDPTMVEGGLINWEPSVRAIDAFFNTHAPAAWKTRGNDMPLKAVKTTLSHLCKSLGSEFLSLVDECGLKANVIRQYADLMLQAAGKEKKEDGLAAATSAPVSATIASATTATSTKKTVENADPNPSSSEYMTRLIELRRRFGLDSIPVEDNSAAATSAQANADAADAAEKKIAELRLRLQAVRAPYESADAAPLTVAASVTVPASASSVPAPVSAAPAPVASNNNDAQAQLAAIRERLARFQQSSK